MEKSLLNKHGDLNSNPQHLHKSLALLSFSVSLAVGAYGRETNKVSPKKMMSFWFCERSCPKAIKKIHDSAEHPFWSLTEHTDMHTHTFTYTQTHICTHIHMHIEKNIEAWSKSERSTDTART